MADTLKRFDYAHASRADRGVLRCNLEKVTGQSRAQITRRITQFLAGGRINASASAQWSGLAKPTCCRCWPR